MTDEDQLYCGCCGNEIGRLTRSDPEWCGRCESHVRRSPGLAPWNRTFYAQHKRDCPWQVPMTDEPVCPVCGEPVEALPHQPCQDDDQPDPIPF